MRLYEQRELLEANYTGKVKYNLSYIMKKASLYIKDGLTRSEAVKKAWQVVKRIEKNIICFEVA